MSRASIFLAGLVIVTGCAERAVIRSDPEDARVFINDQMIGTTPVVFAVERDELADSYKLRLEKDGYESYEGNIPTSVAPGRATGAVFTLGILYLFRSPRALDAPGTIPLRPSLEAEADRRLGKELRELNQLLERNQISTEEFANRCKRLVEPK